MEKGSKVKVLVDGKLKDGYVIGTVPTLWGGESVVVKIGKKELVFDKKSIRK